jgi:hypothetical protein
MTTTAIWTYDQYLAAVLPQGVAATVAEHDLADGHQIGRNDGLDDWLDQSEDTTWREDLSMKGDRPEEWCGFHRRALAELIAAIEAELTETDSNAAEVVENAIEKSQNENRVVEINDNEAVRLVLSRECNDNCDGDNGNYWGENEHGSWCVCVGIEVTT